MRVFTHVLFALIAVQLAFGLQVATAAVVHVPFAAVRAGPASALAESHFRPPIVS